MKGGYGPSLSLIGPFTGNVTESFAQLTLCMVTNEWRAEVGRALIGYGQQ